MITPEDRIELNFVYAQLPTQKLFQSVLSRLRPRSALASFTRIAVWVVIWIGVIGLFQLLNGGTDGTIEIAMVALSAGALASLLAVIVQSRTTQSRLIDALAAAPSRRSGTIVVLDATGVTVHGEGSQSFLSWRSVEDVMVAHDTTLIMPSRVEFLPIPHAALPPGVTPEALATQIATWRST